MFMQAMEFLLGTLLGLLTLAFLLRCYLQLTGAPFHNPLSQAIVSLTNFAVRPVRRIVPSIGWLDTASLLLALLTQLAFQLSVLWLHDFPLLVADPQVYLALLGLAVLGILKLTLYIILYAVILQAVLSWLNPHTPIAPVLDSLTRPFLGPLRRRMPYTAGVDLTPLIVFILVELLLMLLVAPLEQQLMQLF
ncbi:MAG: YggT family protein [Methylophilaceae bacterium]|jgi:YggT family protein|uniref:YggT family protein n=1 Tax=Methylobacillus sp. MM3 TaxID=1848039 RepID=UPI0007E23F63|nr:YggT family protein [Methylobacillus sp. MM3]OAJ69402.1 osmotic-shock protein [Methylobacillus sp. MM3]